jgi:hypothetical protein
MNEENTQDRMDNIANGISQNPDLAAKTLIENLAWAGEAHFALTVLASGALSEEETALVTALLERAPAGAVKVGGDLLMNSIARLLTGGPN